MLETIYTNIFGEKLSLKIENDMPVLNHSEHTGDEWVSAFDLNLELTNAEKYVVYSFLASYEILCWERANMRENEG